MIGGDVGENLSRRRILVTGAGGFIGGHLTRSLIERGDSVIAADCKPLSDWHQIHDDAKSVQLDLAERDSCLAATRGVDMVYNLAADMGGIGFIENHKAECMLSSLINTHLLMACRDNDVPDYFFSSSACVYAADKQDVSDVTELREEDAYPAMPEDGYGWEKLFAERMCRHFREDYGINTRVARYHNVYGPDGAFEGGREKAPAAICRKVANAVLSGKHEIEIWGDGEQTRSFMYIDDCLVGTTKIAESDCLEPLNLGSSELVTINHLVDLVEDIAGVKLDRHHDLSAPQGVRGRNSDNTMIAAEIGWVPEVRLREGLEITYEWVYNQLAARVQV